MFIATSPVSIGDDLLPLFSQQVFIGGLLVLGTRCLVVHTTEEFSALTDLNSLWEQTMSK